LARWRRYPLLGEATLMPLSDLRGAARLVRSHRERLDGQGFPDGLAGAELPLAAQIVGLAATFEGLQAGRLSERRHDADQARSVIRGAAGSHFAPALVEAFETLMNESPVAKPHDRELSARDLQPGMVLARDLLSPQGTLLLAAGYVFDAAVIRTIQELISREGLRIVFHIREPEAAEALAA
jgi:hypothetical protein